MGSLSTSALGAMLLLGAGCTDAPPPPCEVAWEVLVDDADVDPDDLGCALLSVTGPAADDLWFAGGSLGAEPVKACALHFDGERWRELPLGVTETLWWVARTPSGAAWFVGEGGTAVRWADGAATPFPTGVDATLFGVWAASDDDVWAVGGSNAGGDTDVLLHFDGAAWTRVPSPSDRGTLWFKVWGTAADDVWVVGDEGRILHHDGRAWSVHTEYVDGYGTRPRLFTVAGRAADDVWAVGESTTLLHFDGAGWTRWSDPTGAPIFGGVLTGVSVPEGGSVCVVGDGGVKLRVPDQGAHVEDSSEGTGADLHAVWCDAEGTTFAVGGNHNAFAPPAREGALEHRGCEIPTVGLP